MATAKNIFIGIIILAIIVTGGYLIYESQQSYCEDCEACIECESWWNPICQVGYNACLGGETACNLGKEACLVAEEARQLTYFFAGIILIIVAAVMAIFYIKSKK